MSSTTSNRVDLSIDAKGIAHVQLARPDKLNALDLAMFEALAETARQLQTQRHIRAVILSGQGRAFCTGLDVKSMFGDPLKLHANIERLLRRPEGSQSNLAQDVAYLWRTLPVPVLCAIHGMCYGGGLQIALGADLRYASPDAQLSIMETKWGLIPDMGASVLLRELVSIDVAKELTWTGRTLSGQEAAQLGLATTCVDQPLEHAMKVANEIVANSPDAVAKAKQLYQETYSNMSEGDCLKLETKLQRDLLVSWNQMAATGRNFGIPLPYANRKDIEETITTDTKDPTTTNE
jgi:enoyl-CoA hydratase/carnithine racemase